MADNIEITEEDLARNFGPGQTGDADAQAEAKVPATVEPVQGEIGDAPNDAKSGGLERVEHVPARARVPAGARECLAVGVGLMVDPAAPAIDSAKRAQQPSALGGFVTLATWRMHAHLDAAALHLIEHTPVGL